MERLVWVLQVTSVTVGDSTPGEWDAHGSILRPRHPGSPLGSGLGGGRVGEDHRFLTVLFPSCSGVIGSGLCVFSRFPILDTLLYQYSLNGYPYMVSGVRGTRHRGAWPHGA